MRKAKTFSQFARFGSSHQPIPPLDVCMSCLSSQCSILRASAVLVQQYLSLEILAHDSEEKWSEAVVRDHLLGARRAAVCVRGACKRLLEERKLRSWVSVFVSSTRSYSSLTLR